MAAFCCLLAACGGGTNGPPARAGGAASANEIFGGERLGWSQSAPNVGSLRSYVFNLYVDGERANLGDTRCGDVADASGYQCSGVLPTMAAGTRTLRVTATANGVESEPSQPLTVTVGRRVDTSATVPTPSGDPSQLTGEPDTPLELIEGLLRCDAEELLPSSPGGAPS
jgi:hypothetical protein